MFFVNFVSWVVVYRCIPSGNVPGGNCPGVCPGGIVRGGGCLIQRIVIDDDSEPIGKKI